jgi:hypothetical protein
MSACSRKLSWNRIIGPPSLQRPLVLQRQVRHQRKVIPLRAPFHAELVVQAAIALIGEVKRDGLEVNPWRGCGRAAAIDRTTLAALGGVWHKEHRLAGAVPHTSIDTAAGWTKSGWHGWVYGWKRHPVVAVAAVWIPLAARLTPANRADNAEAFALLGELPAEVRYLLGDSHYNDPDLRARAEAGGRALVTTRRGRYPHTGDGVEVRRVFHALRSHSIEDFNESFKAIFDAHGQVPTRGLVATRRFALGAVFTYQILLRHQHLTGGDLRVGLKPLLKAA